MRWAVQAGYEYCPPTVGGSEVIPATIIKNLEEADLVLCDMTLWNANVFFELGIRVALDRPVVVVRDKFTTDIPFDNVMVSAHTYDPRMETWVVRAELPKLYQHIEESAKQTQNSLWKYFGITTRAAHADPSDPVESTLKLVLSEISGLRQENLDLRRQMEWVASGGVLELRTGGVPMVITADGAVRSAFKREKLIEDALATLSRKH